MRNEIEFAREGGGGEAKELLQSIARTPTTATKRVRPSLSVTHQTPARSRRRSLSTIDHQADNAAAVPIRDGHKGSNTRFSTAVTADPAKVPSLPITAMPDQYPIRGGQREPVSQFFGAAASDQEGHRTFADHRISADLIATIRELWRQRQAWHRAEKRLTLQASAICRRYCEGDKRLAAGMLKRIEHGTPLPEDHGAIIATAPLLAARAQIEPVRLAHEKQLAKLAKSLPVAEFALAVRGVGALSLAGIVGEAGDIGSYRSVSALWKRMGLAPGQKGGDTRAYSTWRSKGGLSDVDWMAAGYSPARRSVMFNIGGGLIGAMGHGPRPRVGEDVSTRDDLTSFQKLFIERLRHEAARDHEMRLPDAERGGEVFESYSAHAANRARRYVEKRFLRMLFAAWRECSAATDGLHPYGTTPPSTFLEAAE